MLPPTRPKPRADSARAVLLEPNWAQATLDVRLQIRILIAILLDTVVVGCPCGYSWELGLRLVGEAGAGWGWLGLVGATWGLLVQDKVVCGRLWSLSDGWKDGGAKIRV